MTVESPEDLAKSLAEGNTSMNEIEQAFHDNHIGNFGICIDDIEKDDMFHYVIAGRYAGGNVPKEMELYEIPASLWAKFFTFLLFFYLT